MVVAYLDGGVLLDGHVCDGTEGREYVSQHLLRDRHVGLHTHKESFRNNAGKKTETWRFNLLVWR